MRKRVVFAVLVLLSLCAFLSGCGEVAYTTVKEAEINYNTFFDNDTDVGGLWAQGKNFYYSNQNNDIVCVNINGETTLLSNGDLPDNYLLTDDFQVYDDVVYALCEEDTPIPRYALLKYSTESGESDILFTTDSDVKKWAITDDFAVFATKNSNEEDCTLWVCDMQNGNEPETVCNNIEGFGIVDYVVRYTVLKDVGETRSLYNYFTDTKETVFVNDFEIGAAKINTAYTTENVVWLDAFQIGAYNIASGRQSYYLAPGEIVASSVFDNYIFLLCNESDDIGTSGKKLYRMSVNTGECVCISEKKVDAYKVHAVNEYEAFVLIEYDGVLGGSECLIAKGSVNGDLNKILEY